MTDAPVQPQQWLGRLTVNHDGRKLIGWIEDYAGWRICLDGKLDADGTFQLYGELQERQALR